MNKQKQRHEDATVVEKFPNEAAVGDGEARKLPENNYFANHDDPQIKKKYLQFTVYMEALNQVLELDRYATVETFAIRIRHLVEREAII